MVSYEIRLIVDRHCEGNTVILWHVSQKSLFKSDGQEDAINPLTHNDDYSGRTAPLNSKYCILYIYSTNKGTEYFKHGIYSPFFLFKMQFVSQL